MRLELSRKTDYGVRAMLVLAHRPAETVSSPSIALAARIPVHFVSQVMGGLVRAGLVHAAIGRTGGYRLASDPEAISVLAIVDAIEGDSRRGVCVVRGGPCHPAAPCEIHNVISGAQEAFRDELRAVSLGTLCAAPRWPTRARRASSQGMRPPVRAAAGSASRESS